MRGTKKVIALLQLPINMLSVGETEYLRQKRMEKIMIRKSLFPKDLQNIILNYCRWKYVVKRKMDEKLVGISNGKIVFYSDLNNLVIAKVYNMKGDKIFVRKMCIDIGDSKSTLYPLAYRSTPITLYTYLSRYNEKERTIELDDWWGSYRLLLSLKKTIVLNTHHKK